MESGQTGVLEETGGSGGSGKTGGQGRQDRGDGGDRKIQKDASR